MARAVRHAKRAHGAKRPHKASTRPARPSDDTNPPALGTLADDVRRLRSEIVAAGTPLIGWDDIERELADARRGRG